MMDRIIIGSAQFGGSYGIANTSGPPTLDELDCILRLAEQAGITKIDTAPAYGDAEKRLGAVGIRNWKVTTKIRISAQDTNLRDHVIRSAEQSLSRLNATRLDSVLLHGVAGLTRMNADLVLDAMDELKSSGVTDRVGLSIYDLDEIELLSGGRQIDLVQCPLSPLDQRPLAADFQSVLSDRGAVLVARSLFLQGVLLQQAEQRNEYFGPWSDVLSRFDRAVRQSNLTPAHYCLAFVSQQAPNSDLLVGVDSAKQLRDIISCASSLSAHLDEANLGCDDLRLIDPRKWNAFQ